MTLRATFVGINRYKDPNVRDLTGASRDATALWALFSDTLEEDLSGSLLVDEEATSDGIRTALQATLADAEPHDIAIVSFSGHGSHDHRLAVHDTDLSDLQATAISMDEIANLFRQSRARAVLCILDCCFSGGAPARVLENSPIGRDAISLTAIAGEGRLLLAASNVDEVAYEDPRSRFGLLTKALVDVLTEGDGDVRLLDAMGEIQDRVRAEAGRMGVTQTPVLLGQVIGGLSLPRLRRGEAYRTAFPDYGAITVGAPMTELAAFNIPADLLHEWSTRLPNGLNQLQLQAVNDYRVLDGQSVLVVAPTSSGKTFIGEMAAVRAVLDGRKAVFLFPYRALVNEKFDQFSSSYETTIGMRVVRCTGDHNDQISDFVRGKYEIAVLTYEMFLNLAVSNQGVLNQLGLVVVDEAQFIADPGRGITVELLLTYLLAARERGVNPQLIALSAVIGDINDFHAWLDCRALITHERPVPLVEGVLDRTGTYQYLEGDESRTRQLLPPGTIHVRRDKPSAQDMIVPLVRTLVAQGEQIIVFRNTRGLAQGCARYLANELGLPPATAALQSLPQQDLSAASGDLRQCLTGGTAFHNTNLIREEREVVERTFRDPTGGVRVLVATTTVAAGINTPASTVVLVEQEFLGEDARPFTVAEYKNMAGRAGRLGYREKGKSIILAESPTEREWLFQTYVRGRLDRLTSSFDPRHLDTWIVRLLTQVSRVPEETVIQLLVNTYGGYVAAKASPAWRAGIETQLNNLVQRMLGLGLLESESGQVQLTLLGRACGLSALPLQSAMRLVELLRRVGPTALTPETLMALLQALPAGDMPYTPLFKRGRKEAARITQAAQRYGNGIVQLLQSQASDEWEYFARCKRAAILWDWIHGVTVDDIERTYSVTPFQGNVTHGDIRAITDTTRFHLNSAHQITTVLFPGSGPDQDAIDALLKQLEMGIPSEVLPLLALPIDLSRGEYLQLMALGVRTVDDLWRLSPQRITQVIGAPRSARLEAHRPAPTGIVA